MRYFAKYNDSGGVQSRLQTFDLINEVAASLSQRPLRIVLSMLGTFIGVGALVAVVGLTTTATSQVSTAFSVQQSTTVTVVDAVRARGNDASTTTAFPANAEEIVNGLNGVVVSGITAPLKAGTAFVSPHANERLAASIQLAFASATPGYFQALGATMDAGSYFNDFQAQKGDRVAVIGVGAAHQLGITNLSVGGFVFIEGTAFRIVGVLGAVERQPVSLQTVYIPPAAAVEVFGPLALSGPSEMIIKTELGAAPLIASQAAMAMRPDLPQDLSVQTAGVPSELQGVVLQSLQGLLLGVGSVIMLMGAASIATVSLVSVIERSSEIGLRRSLGARSVHVAAQFLAESAVIGLFGGLAGGVAGSVVVLVLSFLNSWTAVLSPLVVLLAPIAGLTVGLVAGTYPAIRAARMLPATTLRR